MPCCEKRFAASLSRCRRHFESVQGRAEDNVECNAARQKEVEEEVEEVEEMEEVEEEE